MAYTPPAYMISFMNEMRERDNKSEERDERLQATLDLLSSRISVLEETVRQNKNEAAAEIQTVRKKVDMLTRTISADDSCDILITGLPASFNATHAEIITKVFTQIKIPVASSHVLESRLWKPASAATTSTSAPSKMATFSLVVHYRRTPLIMDIVLKKASALNSVDANAIFGLGERTAYSLMFYGPKKFLPYGKRPQLQPENWNTCGQLLKVCWYMSVRTETLH